MYQVDSKILIVATEDEAFCQHRLPTARGLQAAGYQIVVAANERNHRARIESEGFAFVHWPLRRGSVNPLTEMRSLFSLMQIIKDQQPNLIYSIGIKPNFYSSICRATLGLKRHIAVFAGLGTVFVAQTPDMKLLRWFLVRSMKWFMTNRQTWLVTQNTDDQATLKSRAIGRPERLSIVPGSGIDMDDFPVTPEPDDGGPVRVIMVARMLWYKGIGEVLEMSEKIAATGQPIQLVLVGDPDDANPGAVPRSLLQDYHDRGLIEWLGQRSDIAELLQKSHIALLPSYGEGIPKTLLEAGSTGRPLVAFDVPGCRDLIVQDVNGVIVPFQDVDALTATILDLGMDKKKRQRLGAGARESVEKTYSSERIGDAVTTLVKEVEAYGQTGDVMPQGISNVS